MSHEITPFESIRRTNPAGNEFWSSRDFAKVLGYADYRNFQAVIESARTACFNSGQRVEDHFVDVTEMVEIGKGGQRPVRTVMMSRYACYLVIQNADPAKEIVAQGQTYFAIQTRRQELSERRTRHPHNSKLSCLTTETKLFIYTVMPSYARKHLIPDGADCVVHAVSRCVRRAWLCGYDDHDGRSYEHRRHWVQQRVQHLADVFAVEVCAYAIMSNHSHLVLWCRPSVAAEWSAEEVARRWLSVFGRVGGNPTGEDCRRAAGNTEKIGLWRGRLGSVSWFMRCLNEWVARKANAEDDCTGRFWEGRFKCQLLEDDGAILACLAYIDLNPVRAKLADSLEGCEFTSIHDRVLAMRARSVLGEGETEGDLATRRSAVAEPPNAGDGGDEEAGVTELPRPEPIPAHEVVTGMPAATRADAVADAWLCPMGVAAGRHTVLAISAEDYVALVDWTGRHLAEGKRGVLAAEMSPILERMDLATGNWLETVSGFGGLFHRVVGKPGSLERKARQMNQQWLAGVRASRTVFRRRAAA